MRTVGPPLRSYLPALIVDRNSAAALQLASQIRHSGFEADIAASYRAARAAVRAKHYGTLVVAADLNLAADLAGLSDLRRGTSRAWIIVIGLHLCAEAYRTILEHGADSLLIAPFQFEELVFRLSAFSHRSRPP